MTIHISTVGIVATAPKLIHTTDGVAFCTFRLAVSERRYDKELRSWADSGTSWFSIAAFRTLGEHASESFHVGDRILVSGKLRTREWEKDNRQGTSVDIEAEALGHELRWGTSEFHKSPQHLKAAESSHLPGWTVAPHEESVEEIDQLRSA